MTIARVQAAHITGASPAVASISTTAGNLIVALAMVDSGTTLPVITDSAGQTWTAAVSMLAGRVGALFYVPNSAALSSVTATLSGKSIALSVLEISGADTSAPLDKTGSHTISYSNYTISASGANASAADAVVVGVLHTYGHPTTTDGTYTTETDNQLLTPVQVSVRLFDKVVSATETSSMAITVTGYGETALIATFKAATGGGGTSYTLTAGTGAVALSGNAAALTSARKVAVATGSFTLSGKAVALPRGRTLAAGTGIIALSGQSAAFPVARKVAAATGGLTLSGIAAGLSRGIRLTAAPGSFAITGQAAAFPRGRTMAAAMGAFGLTGIAAATRASRLVSAGVGAIVLTGRAAGLIVVSGPIARTLTAVTGGFTLSGLDAALLLSTAAPAGNFYPHFRRARRC